MLWNGSSCSSHILGKQDRKTVLVEMCAIQKESATQLVSVQTNKHLISLFFFLNSELKMPFKSAPNCAVPSGPATTDLCLMDKLKGKSSESIRVPFPSLYPSVSGCTRRRWHSNQRLQISAEQLLPPPVPLLPQIWSWICRIFQGYIFFFNR